MATRAELLAYAARTHQTEPEHLWSRYPNYAVLRHRHNRKWYAVLMDVERRKLGLAGDGTADIVNVKAPPELVASLSAQIGFHRAYHMNGEHWLTILLDGTVPDGEIFALIDGSFRLTE